MSRARLLALVVAAGAFPVVGCGDADPVGSPTATRTTATDASARKRGTGERRRDPAPLLRRFAALPRPVSVTWLSGTIGDPRVPGPSTYWIDAAVRLSPEAMDALVERTGAASGSVPDVVDGLRRDLAPGPWLGSDRLDRAFSDEHFSSRVLLDSKRRQLVLTARGEG